MPSPSSPSQPAPESHPDRFFGLSTAQVAGSALAAATSAVAASFLGVAGTIIGALMGSIVATIASAIYSQSLRRAAHRLRVLRPVPVSGTASTEPRVVTGPARRERKRTWPRVAVGVVAGAALALGAITGIEGLLGHPISSSSRGGTSVGEALGGSAGSGAQRNRVRVPAPAATQPGPVPSASVRPTPVPPATGASERPSTSAPAGPAPSQTPAATTPAAPEATSPAPTGPAPAATPTP